ncbi:MAG: CoA transferase, partial [Dehalococcoidia bacterium]
CRGEDRWLAIACDDEAQWNRLIELMGAPDWANESEFATNAARVANQDALDSYLSVWTRGFEPFDLMLLLQAKGIAAGAVQTIADRMERDPQLEHRGYYQSAGHAELGQHRFEGIPFSMSRSDWRVEQGAPLLGEHNETGLCDLLGLSEDEMFELTLEAATV